MCIYASLSGDKQLNYVNLSVYNKDIYAPLSGVIQLNNCVNVLSVSNNIYSTYALPTDYKGDYNSWCVVVPQDVVFMHWGGRL